MVKLMNIVSNRNERKNTTEAFIRVRYAPFTLSLSANFRALNPKSY